MYVGQPLFAQVMDFLPWNTFHRIVARHGGDHRFRTLTCAEHFRILAFAQLTYRERLRDIEACIYPETDKTPVFLIKDFTLPTATICALYKTRS